MKLPDFQRPRTTENRVPSVLAIPEEKSSIINIFNNQPLKCRNSPFESRQNDRKKYPYEDNIIPFSNNQKDTNSELSNENSEELFKQQRRNEIINYISEPFYNTLDSKKIQNKNDKRQKNMEERNQKSIESSENPKNKKKHKKREIKVEIDKVEEPVNNNRKRINDKYSKSLLNNKISNDNNFYYCEIPIDDNDSALNNVSFSNKNIDTNTLKNLKPNRSTNIIDPKIFKQFRLISEMENNKIIKQIELEKDKLNKQNKKLSKDYFNLEKEREKFEKEKKLFFESRDRVIDDSRKNEERLIQLENELQNKFLKKKEELEQMRNELKQEQIILDKERDKMRNNYQMRLSKLEEDYKIKEETQNYNNNLNMDKTRKEQELLRKKEFEINELNKAFKKRENDLNMRENDLINKENELQKKEEILNTKYQSLIKKENDLKGEKEKFMNNNEENEKDLYMKTEELKNKEEELNNRENMLQGKENEIKYREDMINNVENELKNRENQLNKTEFKLSNQQNEIDNKEKTIYMLNQEIKDKQNKIIELNNAYNNMISKLSPKKEKNELQDSKGNKKIDAEINNLESINRPSITAVKKLDRKFQPNLEINNESNNLNFESQPTNKVMTFGNKSSLASNLTNNKDIRDNDSYPENNLKDIKDNGNFPENHLHDIQDNDEHPENHGEDDFLYGNKNNENNEDYGEMGEDFEEYIHNQSQHEKSQNSNNDNKNDNLFMNEQEQNMNEDNKTEPYNFLQENNNDLLESKNSEYKNNINTPNNNNFMDDNNNNENIPQNFIDNKMNGQNQLEKNNRLNESESGEINLKDLHHEELDIDGSQNRSIRKSEVNDHEEEINDINEELFIEEYNPSLGLVKIDNPNYLNSLLQCFAHIPEITDKIINLHLDLNFNNQMPNLKLTKKYRNFLINIFFPEKVYNMERQAFNPTKFHNVINELNSLFQNNENIELKEFLNYFILKLHDELNTKKDNLSNYPDQDKNNEMQMKNANDSLVDFLKSFTEKNNSIISKTIYGISKYIFYCNQCQNSFYNYHCYSHLFFNLENVLDYKINRYHKEDVELNLIDCLDYYQKSETLRGNDGIFCPFCKTQTESTSIKNIYSTKNVIIFILGRNSGNKFDQTFVNFEETLNLRDYVEYKKEGEKNREKFFLGGVVNYYLGNDENSGTYNAYVRMGKKNDWYCYDDENVYSVTFDDIKNNGFPVVLFYHKLVKKGN